GPPPRSGSIPTAPAAAVAATATAAAAVAAAPRTPTAAAAVLPGLGLVDGQGPAADDLAVEGGDGGLGLLVAAHLHEAEPLGPAGLAIHDHLGRLHGAVGSEQLLQGGVRRVVAQ